LGQRAHAHTRQDRQVQDQRVFWTNCGSGRDPYIEIAVTDAIPGALSMRSSRWTAGARNGNRSLCADAGAGPMVEAEFPALLDPKVANGLGRMLVTRVWVDWYDHQPPPRLRAV
jgi:hypothetical protein